MESSHRRTINDLEEKHKQEIERLLIEKETALAEETQVSLHWDQLQFQLLDPPHQLYA